MEQYTPTKEELQLAAEKAQDHIRNWGGPPDAFTAYMTAFIHGIGYGKSSSTAKGEPTHNPLYKKSIEELSDRERQFFDVLVYILKDEELALGYCGNFESIAAHFMQSGESFNNSPVNADFETALEAEIKRHQWGIFGKQLWVDGANWAKDYLHQLHLQTVEGPWKYEVHHTSGVPETGCSGDEYATISDGKVTLYIDGGEEDGDELKVCNLLNQLKIKLDYDHSAEYVAHELEKEVNRLCGIIRELEGKQPSSIEPSRAESDGKLFYYDLSMLGKTEKQKFAYEVTKAAMEQLMVTFYSLDLSSHMDLCAINGDNGDEFILAFRKTVDGKLLGPVLPMATTPFKEEIPLELKELSPDEQSVLNKTSARLFSKTPTSMKASQPSTSKEEDIIYRIVEQWGNAACSMEEKVQWLKAYAKECHQQPAGESAGVWVRASDRLPENNNLVHLKYGTKDTEFRLTGYYEPSEGCWHNQNGTIYNWAPNLEWLDESLASTAEERMIAFGEFLLNYAPIEKQRRIMAWWDKVIGGKFYTTSELCDLYLQSLTKK